MYEKEIEMLVLVGTQVEAPLGDAHGLARRRAHGLELERARQNVLHRI